jgi:hypothetical protein
LKLATLTLPEDFLTFGTTNAKLAGQGIATFSLPAGYTCPGAKDCLSKFDRKTRKIRDGRDTEYRCYAASLEASFRSVSDSVDRNLALLKKAKALPTMVDLIENSLPQRGFSTIRVHAHGDFYSADYFIAWMELARRNPKRLFYAYTKSLQLWIRFQPLVPQNFVLTASYGGKWDALIEKHDLRNAVVVYHPDEATALGLEIDHDDSLARDPKVKRFALLLHGTQAAGSDASAAIKRLKQEGVAFSYGRKGTPAQSSKLSVPHLAVSEQVWEMTHPKA